MAVEVESAKRASGRGGGTHLRLRGMRRLSDVVSTAPVSAHSSAVSWGPDTGNVPQFRPSV